MRQIISFAKGQQAFESIQSVPSQDHPKRKRASAGMELPKPGVYLYNYQTEAAIFLATKHKKDVFILPVKILPVK